MIYDEDPLRRRPRESTARRLRHERCVWMARETTKWPSTRWPITKIMSSDGCDGNRVPLEMGPWYDFREIGCHLGNVGLNVAVVETDFNPGPIASTAFAIVNGHGLVLPRYLWIVLRSPFMVVCVEDNQRGQAYPAINDADFCRSALSPPTARRTTPHRCQGR